LNFEITTGHDPPASFSATKLVTRTFTPTLGDLWVGWINRTCQRTGGEPKDIETFKNHSTHEDLKKTMDPQVAPAWHLKKHHPTNQPKNVKKTAGSSITQPHHVHANHEDDRRGW